MSDHVVDATKMVCVHCGLPADRSQNGIQSYRCGSSFAEAFKPQWARSMTCLEMEIRHLNEDIGNMNMQLVEQEDHIKQLEAAGDAMAQDHNPFTFIDWQRAKEAKP
jgi:hypothetical protein